MTEMAGQTIDSMSMCEILDCSSEASTTRWVITEDQGKRELRVCSRHAEGDVDPETLPVGG